jgi:1-acyl-sn-glycerol-3-phosphate acyltransferase
VGPHTSWKDQLVGLAARSILRLRQIKFLGKKELFVEQLGVFFRSLGPNRSANKGTANKVAPLFNANQEFILALSPEGTRRRVERLRTGFYFIARHAEIPIVMIGLDFSNRKLIISEPFYTTDDQQKDFETILSFYSSINGKHPEFGLQHFQVK